MRTNVTLDDDVYELIKTYAVAREITLGAAIGELIRDRNRTTARLFSRIKIGPNGVPILSSLGGPMTLEKVNSLRDGDVG